MCANDDDQCAWVPSSPIMGKRRRFTGIHSSKSTLRCSTMEACRSDSRHTPNHRLFVLFSRVYRVRHNIGDRHVENGVN